MKRIAIAVLAASTILTGCTTRLIDFTVISSKNVDMARSSDFIRDDARVMGEDTIPIVIFPVGMPNAKEAMDSAIQSTPGCVALLDGVLEHEFFSFIFGYATYRVKGTCLIDPKLIQKQ